MKFDIRKPEEFPTQRCMNGVYAPLVEAIKDGRVINVPNDKPGMRKRLYNIANAIRVLAQSRGIHVTTAFENDTVWAKLKDNGHSEPAGQKEQVGT